MGTPCSVRPFRLTHRNLIQAVVQVEAYMFGSVPLKTYLPDGDIDLAVFQGKGPRLRDIWTYELSALLEAEGRNPLNPHRVKDVQIINAEVWAVCT